MPIKFSAGQIIHHKRFGYRGVIVGADERFEGTEEWYQTVAVSRPPRDRPWYHVLVDGSENETYVAERNLELDDSIEPVEHPLVDMFFDEIIGGRYVRNRLLN